MQETQEKNLFGGGGDKRLHHLFPHRKVKHTANNCLLFVYVRRLSAELSELMREERATDKPKQMFIC